jgi:hypothetical protein
VITRLSANDDGCDALALRSGGGVLVGDFVKQGTNQNMGFLRYRSNGTLDPAFNGDGKQIVDLHGQETIRGLAVQGTGRSSRWGPRGLLPSRWSA